MKMKSIPVILLAFLIGASSAFASGRKLGTSGAPELLIPMGARNVGMGGANVADVQGPESIYWNPAGLALLKGMEVSVSYMSYFADMSVSYLALGAAVGNLGTLGLSVQSLEIGEIPVTTIESPEGTGEILRPDYITATVSFSRDFSDRINFGTNVKLISEAIGDMQATAVAFDFGLQYVTPWGIGLGVVMRNFGSRIKFDGNSIEFNSDVPWAEPDATTRKTKLDMASQELPAGLDMGISYRLNLGTSQSLSISSCYSSGNYSLDRINTGAEFNLSNLLFLRAGYVTTLFPEDYAADSADEDIDKSPYTGLSYGFGLKLGLGESALSFDYAYRAMDVFSANQYFSLSFGF